MILHYRHSLLSMILHYLFGLFDDLLSVGQQTPPEVQMLDG